ncbi:MAG TPA: cytochrome c [Longimicrobiales bacterium]
MAALLLAVLSGGCTQFENAMASVPIFSYLRNAPSFDPYENPRPAPYGSVPFNTPAGESLGPEEATEAGLNAFAATISNPLQPNDSLALRAGKVMFDRNCMVCHNTNAQGNGPIVGPGKFPMAPNLTLPATVARSDAYIYAIIRAGRGLMPAYGPRMNHLERWATVMYLRQLQRNAGANPAATPTAPTANANATGAASAPAAAKTQGQ